MKSNSSLPVQFRTGLKKPKFFHCLRASLQTIRAIADMFRRAHIHNLLDVSNEKRETVLSVSATNKTGVCNDFR
jgi:hypothetical protein